MKFTEFTATTNDEGVTTFIIEDANGSYTFDARVEEINIDVDFNNSLWNSAAIKARIVGSYRIAPGGGS